MKIYSLKKHKLKEVNSSQFKLEKDIQSLVEKNLDELFGFDLIQSEFVLGGFRLDSLCYDKSNNSVVIIEYKKGKSYSVIDQGFSYLSNVLDNKSEIILEIQEVFGRRLKKDEVDWTNTKIIFISPSFSTYQKESINFQDLPVELYEITQFDNKTIGLNSIVGKTNAPSIKEIKKGSQIDKVNRVIKKWTEQDHINGWKDKNYSYPKSVDQIVELYFKYKTSILDSFDRSEIRFTKLYIVFQSGKNHFVDFYLGKDDIMMWINMKKGTLDDSKKLFRDVSNIGTWGNGDYELKVSNEDNFEYIMSCIRQSYENE
tara:strand:+ start:633 stop:1574 length:942 start_codon:yes stop_codon:yes gene_type:complete